MAKENMLEITIKDVDTGRVIANEKAKFIQSYAVCVEDDMETIWTLSYGKANKEELTEICNMMTKQGFRLMWDDEHHKAKIVAKGKEVDLGD